MTFVSVLFFKFNYWLLFLNCNLWNITLKNFLWQSMFWMHVFWALDIRSVSTRIIDVLRFADISVLVNEGCNASHSLNMEPATRNFFPLFCRDAGKIRDFSWQVIPHHGSCQVLSQEISLREVLTISAYLWSLRTRAAEENNIPRTSRELMNCK